MSKIISLDTETRGLAWFDPEQVAFLATWSDADADYHSDLSKAGETKRFLSAIRSADVLVAHNLSFDVHMVREATGFDILTGRKFLTGQQKLQDTDLLSRVMFPAGQQGGQGGHGLKNLGKVYLRADADGPERHLDELAKSIGYKSGIKPPKSRDRRLPWMAYYDVWRAYPQAMEEYAKLDTRLTWDLYAKFDAMLEGELRRVYELEMRACPVLIRAEQKGVRIDQGVVTKLVKTTKQRQRKAHAFLSKELGDDALGGPGSDAALLEALQRVGVPLHRKTPTGELATNNFALQEFEDDFPVIAQLQELRQSEKFLVTYLEPMVGRDTVHPTFWQCGAWTSRMSASNPNMQNVPKNAGKEIRAMFVPREGHSFVVCDYESIEVRLLAYYMGDQGYRDLIERGLDPHAWMAMNIHGGVMEDYVKGTEGQPKRDKAKNTMFAITYGAGAPRVADMNKISREEAKALIGTIKASLPGYNRLNQRIRAKINRVGYVRTAFGRKQIVNPDKSYVGLNALIQGSAADIFKQAVVNVDSAIVGFGAQILLFVHDELVVECPTPVAERCRQQVEAAMIAAFDLKPSLAVSGKVVNNNYAEAA